MIADAVLKPLVVHADDRGYFLEVLRADDPFFSHFGQSSVSLMYPGLVKAWHWHRQQDDIWYFASGMAQVALHDLREHSPTRGQTSCFFLGDHHRAVLYIPRGVAHGYRALGPTPAMLVYFTTHTYNPADEMRLPWNDPAIGFDWTTQNR